MVFVGVQPTLMHVPPRFFSSISATDHPKSARRNASGLPAWPEPTTMASCFIGVLPCERAPRLYIGCGTSSFLGLFLFGTSLRGRLKTSGFDSPPTTYRVRNTGTPVALTYRTSGGYCAK